ncbi:MAG: protein-glutamate O-methyltransferase CheR [Clostridiaceae bacterium]
MEILEFKKWACKEYNIDLFAYKEPQLDRRIVSQMNRSGLYDFNEYVNLLKKDKEASVKFLDHIYINVTEFFRNPELYKELENIIKNDFIKNNKSIKIWSAACSTGAEPYSVAMLLANLNLLSKSTILATDIDINILNRAKKGEYLSVELKNLNDNYLNKYFTRNDDFYCINSQLKKIINFKKHDLIIDKYEKNFDLIICRNVVIYFKSEIKNKIFENMAESLKTGGYFFIGATESIFNYKDYKLEKISNFIYKKN